MRAAWRVSSVAEGSLTTYDQHRLDLAVQPIRRAFGGRTYLVGSAQQRRDARDVDVRTIVDDDTWDALFAPFPQLWELLCIGTTAWLREQTGLPIDYQIQRLTEANEQHPGGWRSALGLGQNDLGRLYAGGGDATRWPTREEARP